MELRLGFFASHNGSNVEAIVKNILENKLNASAKVLISNNPSAKVLEFGDSFNIPSYCLNSNNCESLDETIIKTLKDHDVNLIILAGYMKKLGNSIICDYNNRILNIHPALLPKYGGKGMYGMHVHEAVIKNRDIESGATIHLVNENYDEGKIIAQYKVPRYVDDTKESLAQRVLAIEHVCYTQTLKDIQRGIIGLD